MEIKVEVKKTDSEKFTEGVDYYFENGLMVLTAHFLKKRGYCCKNGCRHCPYKTEEKDEFFWSCLTIFDLYKTNQILELPITIMFFKRWRTNFTQMNLNNC